ncbi:hypothetical protein TNCV_588641 [Trichonephila clavipes]|nr:hypothetical protein TNCV_588641 [Trichonephila clavipes]
MSHLEATPKLMATDFVILNYDQMTRTTPELASPSPNYHTIGRTFEHSSDLTFIAHPTRRIFSSTRPELMTRRPRSDALTTRLPRELGATTDVTYISPCTRKVFVSFRTRACNTRPIMSSRPWPLVYHDHNNFCMTNLEILIRNSVQILKLKKKIQNP